MILIAREGVPMLMWKRLILFSVALWMVGSSAFAEPGLPDFRSRVLLSVKSAVDPSAEWARGACKKLHEMISSDSRVDSRCIRGNSPDELFNNTLGKAEKSGLYLYLIELQELGLKKYRLTVRNWGATDETEPKIASWNLEPRKNGAWEADTALLLKNFSVYVKNREQVKQFFLGMGLGESKRLKAKKDGSGVVDKKTGKEVSGPQAYSIYSNESIRQKNYLRAALELGVLIGLYSIHYYHPVGGGTNENQYDWEYWGWGGQKQKYSDRVSGVRFDDNNFTVNRNHALAGTIYYQVARNQGLSTLESFLFTFAGSSVWEMATEHREVVSINDQIVTPVGGFVIGEVMHQMSQLLLKRSNTLAGKTLAALFDMPGAFERWTNRNNSGFRDTRGTGFDQLLSHVDFYAGGKTGKNPDGSRASGSVTGIHGEVMSIPLFDQPGNISRIYTDSVFTELLVNNETNGTALDDFSALARVVFAAYHKKNLKLDEEGRKRGYTMYVGLGSAVEYGDSRARKELPDNNATVHVLGTSLDMIAFVKGIQMRVRLDVYGDFAMMHSYALDLYGQTHDLSGTVGTIPQGRYYYGMGMTARTNLSMKWSRIEAGVSSSQQAVDSINARNRNQEAVTKNLDYADQTSKGEAYIVYDLNRNWKVRLAYERIERSGTINGDYDSSTTETRGMGTLIYSF